MITVICKLKDGFAIIDAAREVKATLGKGGNPDAQVIEDFIGYTNCPTCNNYFRASFDSAYAAALQYIKDNGGAQTVELIDIEWEGQRMFQTGIDEDGNPEWLGMISNVGVYQEAEEASGIE